MTKSVRLSPDSEQIKQLVRLRAQLAEAKAAELTDGQGLASVVPDLERQVKAAEAEALSSGPVYEFRRLTRREKADIIRQFPPTADQWARYREKAKAYPGYVLDAPEFDMLSAAPSVLATAAVDPPLTLEEAVELWDETSDSDAALLWKTAWDDGDTSRPTSGTGTDMTPTSGPESTTPLNGESL